MPDTLTIVMLIAGGIVVAGGIPMADGRLKPNPWYGFRTATSLARPDVWAATNRVSGRWFIAVGFVVIATTLVLRLFPAVGGPNAPTPGHAALISTGVLALGALAAGVRGLVEQARVVRRSPTPPDDTPVPSRDTPPR